MKWHNTELQYLRNSVRIEVQKPTAVFAASAFNSTADQDSLSREDNSECVSCFPDDSPSLERRRSILLTWSIHMADCKVLGDFLHILKVEERVEASFILTRKRK